MSELTKEVNEAIRAGDSAQVAELVINATEKERRELRKEITDSWWHQFDNRKRPARLVARIGSATARQVASDWWTFSFAPDTSPDLIYRVLAARGSEFFETVARNIVEQGVQRAALLVRRALEEGLIDAPPDRDAYIRGIVVEVGGGWANRESAYDAVRADNSLVDEIWQFFEVDCGTELSNAAAWMVDERGVLVGGRHENRWLDALTRLTDDGVIDRDRLLDAALDALQRDFRPSMVGYYAKVHEALGPTQDERHARVDRYLSLLSSPVPLVVKEGLAGLKALKADVSPDGLARAAAGPLSQKQKNLAVEMLSLLTRATEREPDARPVLLDAAALALAHERADVQERALTLLERYPDEVPRGALLGYVDVVSPTLRQRVEALTGIESTPVIVVDDAPVAPVRTEIVPIEPVTSVDELIELSASLMEGQGDGDDVERFLDGVSRLCAERPQGFERRVAGLVKQASLSGEWGWFTGVGLVQHVVKSWTTGAGASARGLPDTILGFLARRAVEVARRAAKKNARPLLAFPTHSGGRIEFEVLAERVERTGKVLNRPDSNDLLQARLRTVKDPTPISYSRTAVVRDRWNQQTLLLELRPQSLPDYLGPLHETVRAIGRSHRSSIWLDSLSWGSWDALGVRWSLTFLPGHPEVAFAGAARLIADQVDASPQLQPQVVLEHALSPHVPLGDVAWLGVAGGLVTKSPDLQRVATDVLVASIDDGRFEADAVADALGWLFANGFAKASRLQAPLRDVGRVSQRHAAAVLGVTEGLLARLWEAPHGMHAPLEAVLEHAAGAGLAVERPEARATLERFGSQVSRSSKLGRTVQSLLALTPHAAARA
jgi:Family of unknown function (DUF6493)